MTRPLLRLRQSRQALQLLILYCHGEHQYYRQSLSAWTRTKSRTFVLTTKSLLTWFESPFFCTGWGNATAGMSNYLSWWVRVPGRHIDRLMALFLHVCRANLTGNSIDFLFHQNSFCLDCVQFLDTEEKKQRRLVHIPMGRFGTAAEMAKGALFLASDDSSFMTGVWAWHLLKRQRNTCTLVVGWERKAWLSSDKTHICSTTWQWHVCMHMPQMSKRNHVQCTIDHSVLFQRLTCHEFGWCFLDIDTGC